MNRSLLDQFDAAIARRGYGSRSEAVRDLVRGLLVEEEWRDAEVEVAGTVTLVYDHEASHVNRTLTNLQHEHFASVVSTLHVHLDAHNCLEVIVLRGKAADVKRMADLLISLKGVKVGRLTVASTGANLA